MPEKKTRKKAAAAPAKTAVVAAKEKKPTAKKSAKAEEAVKGEKSTRRRRPPLTPEIYVEQNGKQYNISDIVERAKADYRASHKVGVQSCKVYVKPDEATAYYVINKVEGKLEL